MCAHPRLLVSACLMMPLTKKNLLIVSMCVFFVIAILSLFSSLDPALNETPRKAGYTKPHGLNKIFLYSGKWEFLRIQLPYLYRDLRRNGGILDEVHFMMVNYDEKTLDGIIDFTETANKVLKENVFSIHFVRYVPYTMPTNNSSYTLYEITQEFIGNPNNRYFKLDDDIVYIHPQAFANMIKMRKPDCVFHYFNIASWSHQNYGRVFNGHYPKSDFDPHVKCGWKSFECAKLTLETFLRLYDQSKLEQFLFDIEYLTGRERFSINAYMLDNLTYAMQMKKMLDSERKTEKLDDKKFLAEYFQHSSYRPCVIGKALIVHFGHKTVSKQLVDMGFLKAFKDLTKKTKHSFNMPSKLWQVLHNMH